MSALRTWLTENGGFFHPDARFDQVASGSSIFASRDIPVDATIVSCPFDLVITRDRSLDALSAILGAESRLSMQTWSARQLIATYISFHDIVGEAEGLVHHAYINLLPASNQLRTPLHFTPAELELVKGSNLYGATIDRERDWRREWEQCRGLVRGVNVQWAEEYTWERFLTAATHLSSRAFPSTLLSKTPSLVATGESEPILLPGIDALNHGRGQPVSWVSNYTAGGTEGIPGPGSSISLVLHNATPSGDELFNNYGPKPNAELVLGYGFSLADNPDDTIVLKIGGMEGHKWEVGRHARGAEGVWDSVLASITEGEPTYEDYLDASSMLSEMVQSLLERLPMTRLEPVEGVRGDVALMVQHYLEGQRDVLQGLLELAASKEALGVQMAKDEGVEVILE